MDQPDDWTEPGAHAVVDHVYRVPLALPVDGLAAVNVYVIEDPGGLVLIDAGWARPETEKALVEALQSLDTGLGDIDQIIVTHAHWDHYTQALALRESLGTRVRIGWEERHTIEDFDLAAGAIPARPSCCASAAPPSWPPGWRPCRPSRTTWTCRSALRTHG